MTQKTKPAAKRGAAAQKPTSAGSKSVLARLESENAVLKERLAAADLRVAMLERQRDEALNRIAWVIDSIKTLADSVR